MTSEENGSATAAAKDPYWADGARMVRVHWTDEEVPRVRLVVVLGFSGAWPGPPADDETGRIAARQKLAETELAAANERAKAAALELQRTKLLRA